MTSSQRISSLSHSVGVVPNVNEWRSFLSTLPDPDYTRLIVVLSLLPGTDDDPSSSAVTVDPNAAPRWVASDIYLDHFLPHLRNHHEVRSTQGAAPRRALSLDAVDNDLARVVDEAGRAHDAGPSAYTVARATLHVFSPDTPSASAVLSLVLTSPCRASTVDGHEVARPWTVGDVLDLQNRIAFRHRWDDLRSFAGPLVASTPFGSFRIDDVRRCTPAVMCSIVHPEAGTPAAVKLAEALASGLPANSTPNEPLGNPRASGLPRGIERRSSNVLYYSTYMASGVVIASDGADRFIRHSLPLEIEFQYSLAYVYAVHQRNSLLSLSDRLARTVVLQGEEDHGADLEWTEIEALQRDFERFLAWSRFRLLSERSGIQRFYDLVHDAFCLDQLEAEVGRSVTGVARIVSLQNEQAERRSQERLERNFAYGGVFFASVSIVLAVLGVNLAGITATADEGVPVLLVLLLAGTIGSIFLVLTWTVVRNLGRPRKR